MPYYTQAVATRSPVLNTANVFVGPWDPFCSSSSIVDRLGQFGTLALTCLHFLCRKCILRGQYGLSILWKHTGVVASAHRCKIYLSVVTMRRSTVGTLLDETTYDAQQDHISAKKHEAVAPQRQKSEHLQHNKPDTYNSCCQTSLMSFFCLP